MDGPVVRPEQLARPERLRAYLVEQSIAVAVIARPEHIRYLTGWATQLPAAVVLRPEGGVLVVPSDTSGATAAAIAAVDLREYRAYAPDELLDPGGEALVLVRQAVAAAIAPDHRGPVASDVATFDTASSVVDLNPVLRRWRTTKDELEIECIRDRVTRLEAAFRAIENLVRPGVGERRLLAAIFERLQAETVAAFRLDTNLGSGPRSALADPHASDRVLQEGDLVLVDLYPALDGYVADLTRTFVVGAPAPRQADRWAVVREALAAAEALLRPGVPVREVDSVVRAALARAGTGSLPHHVGHGIGLDAWEAPWIGAAAADLLAVGNVIAVEPGLYVDGMCGMRLEGNYVIREHGAERLDRFPDTLGGWPADPHRDEIA